MIALDSSSILSQHDGTDPVKCAARATLSTAIVRVANTPASSSLNNLGNYQWGNSPKQLVHSPNAGKTWYIYNYSSLFIYIRPLRVINLSAHVQLRDFSVTSFLAAVPMARRNDVSTLQRSLQSFAIASGPATFYAEGLRPLLNSFVVPYLGSSISPKELELQIKEVLWALFERTHMDSKF